MLVGGHVTRDTAPNGCGFEYPLPVLVLMIAIRGDNALCVNRLLRKEFWPDCDGRRRVLHQPIQTKNPRSTLRGFLRSRDRNQDGALGGVVFFLVAVFFLVDFFLVAAFFLAGAFFVVGALVCAWA